MSETLFGTTYPTLYDLKVALAGAQPPVTVDPLVPHLPSGKFYEPPPRAHPYDMVRRSRMKPRAVPFNLPMAAPGCFAASKQGVKPTRVYAYHLHSARSFLYCEQVNFTGGRSDPVNKEFGDDLVQIAKWQDVYPNKAGARGIGRADSYCSVISHPFLDLSGVFNDRLPTAIYGWHNRDIGAGYPDGRIDIWGRIPGTLPLYQLAAWKPNRAIMYAAELGRAIIRIDRTAGKAGSGKTEDPTQYKVTDAWLATWPTGVDSHTDGAVYYVDAGDVYRDGVRWQTLGNAFAIVVDSPRNRVAVFCDNMTLRVFNLDGSTQFTTVVEVRGTPPRSRDFFTVDVDENGTNGPAGTFRVTSAHADSNVCTYEIAPDGKTFQINDAIYGSGQSFAICGDVRYVFQPFGHYNWCNHFHRNQALYYPGGYGDNLIHVLACDPPLPAPGFIPRALDWNGKNAFAESGLTSVCSVTGESPYAGCSFDELAELPFDSILDALVHGLITETPRPELAGKGGIQAVGSIVASSQRLMREGKAYSDAYMAWATSRGLTPADYAYRPLPNGGHFVAPPPSGTFLETDGTTIWRTDAGRSTPIRYLTPPLNRTTVQNIPIDAKIMRDDTGERPVVWVEAAGETTKARVL